MIVSPATPQLGLILEIEKVTEVGAGVLVQPTRNNKTIRLIKNIFLIGIPLLLIDKQ
jgi:hypothetical protein